MFGLHENKLDACIGHESPPGFQSLVKHKRKGSMNLPLVCKFSRSTRKKMRCSWLQLDG